MALYPRQGLGRQPRKGRRLAKAIAAHWWQRALTINTSKASSRWLQLSAKALGGNPIKDMLAKPLARRASNRPSQRPSTLQFSLLLAEPPVRDPLTFAFHEAERRANGTTTDAAKRQALCCGSRLSDELCIIFASLVFNATYVFREQVV